MRERLSRIFLDGLRAVLGAQRAHRELLEQAADAIFLAGRDGRFVEVNERACEMLGYRRAELLGRRVAEVLTPEAVAGGAERIAALRAGETLLSERELVRSDGVRVPVEISTRLLSDGRLQGIARDITSRLLAYAALRRSEERLRLALETAGIGMWERDHSTGAAIWSDLARAHLGVSDEAPSEFGTFLAQVHPDDRPRVQRAIAMAHEKGGEFRYEFRVALPDGGVRHLYSLGRVSSDSSGHPQRAIGTLLDITERKLAEAALQSSEQRMRSVLEQTPIILFATDQHGVFTLSQGKGLAALSIQPDQLNGRSVFDVFADIPAITDGMRRALAGNTITETVAIVGRVFEWTCTPMFDGPLQAVVGVTGVATDVTDRQRAEDAVRKLEQQNRLLIDNANDVVIAYDTRGRISFVNQRWEILSGYTVRQALRMSVGDIIHPEDRPGVLSNMRQRVAGGDIPISYPMRIVRQDGEVRWVEANVSLIRDGQHVLGLQAFVRDVTERFAAEEERRRLAAIVESSQDAIISRTLDGTITSWNRGAERLYGYTAEQAVGQHIQVLVPSEAKSESDSTMLRVASGEHIEILEAERVGRDGRLVYISATVSPIHDHAGNVIGVASIARDITERKQAEAALACQARHDALTGLPNRLLLQEQLDVAIDGLTTSRTPLALLLLDLDRFKEVNDALGHGVGDAVLQAVASRLRDAMRTGDTIARLGGDEFAVLLVDADESTALQVAQRVRAALAEPIDVGALSLDVGASIGIALAPKHGRDAATLLRRADLAMYAAKRAGEGIALFTPALDRDNAERLGLTGELRAAIERNQLVLHYQPKMRLADGCVIGVEALVRLQHPTRGLLRPDQFIPVAEQAGLIEPLTYWVLRTARAQQAAWQAAGLQLNMAVNLSVQSLRDSNLLETVQEVLIAHRDCGGQFELELTESMLMSDPARARTLLASLRGLGVRVAVDDFGTGYSSLAYLKRLPLDELKIDRSFLPDVATDVRDAALVRATIDLGHTLGLRVVAEGVEDADSLVLLKDMGCDEVQGYYISRPLVAEALAHWARTWRFGSAAPPLPRAA
jgi:diguanylate cyclase (GGDEF)-like protein/PAS domain S-box-containing protein